VAFLQLRFTALELQNLYPSKHRCLHPFVNPVTADSLIRQEADIQLSSAPVASDTLLPAPGVLAVRVQGGGNVAFPAPPAGVAPFAAQEQDKSRELEAKRIKETLTHLCWQRGFQTSCREDGG